MILHIDFETRSMVELGGSKSVGVYNYALHPSTEVLMMGWAFDDGEVEVWQPHIGPMNAELEEAFSNPKVDIVAFNSAFERNILQHKLQRFVPIHRFVDPQPSARYLSLPGDLEEVGEILGLPKSYAKDKRGKKLIDLFSKPQRKKKRGEEAKFFFNDWTTHPQEWEEFVDYCRQDVKAEREILRRAMLLGAAPLPPTERKIWLFDQTVNDRGIPVDPTFVKNALELASREKEEKIKLNNQKTGLENSNSNDQMTEWAVGQGYRGVDPKEPIDKEGNPKYSLHKDAVASELKKNDKLTPLCREVLEIRKSASSTSYQKMAAILRQISPDDRLRGQFIYMGSPRCGRWSGNAVQFHNMARSNEIFEDEENINKARAMIYAKEYDDIKKFFESVLLTVKYNIRTAFVTKPQRRFNVADLNAIETRVGAWVSGCQPLLDVFEKNHDPYLDFAVKMTQIPYDTLVRDVKSKDPAVKAKAKKHRQIAKPAVLGCIYRMGAPALKEYAEGYGVIMTLEEAAEIVRIFREAYKEIKETWFAIEHAIFDVMEEGTTRVKREIGPGGCVKFDKLTFTCERVPRTILRIQLPSGRYLHYMDAYVEDTLMPFKDGEGNDIYRPALWYASQDQKTKQWGCTTAHGGKTFENIVQGIARDVLAAKLLMFEEAGLSVVGHVHDEGLSETEDNLFAPGVREMNHIMAQPIDWAPGLPLGSDGFEGTYYHK